MAQVRVDCDTGVTYPRPRCGGDILDIRGPGWEWACWSRSSRRWWPYRSSSAAPATAPVTISLTIDRSAPVLSYLEEAGLDRDEAQRWAWSFARAAAGDTLQSGHSLTLYKDPDDGSLRELKYNLDDRVAIRARTYGNGVIRSSQELISYVVRPVA